MVALGITPIPDGHPNRVFGLLEILEDRGGREDGYRLARDLNYAFTDLLKVMKTAEILDFVSTPAGDVVLEPLGRRALESDMNQRKLIVRDQLKKHGLFAYLVRLLRAQEDRALDRDIILEHLAMLLPNEPPERLFTTIVDWGRFAELFGYNKDSDRFYLDQE